jgi:thioredoxin 1
MATKAEPRRLTDADFGMAMARAGGTLVLFTAAWCKPCARSIEEAPAVAEACRMPVMIADIDAAPNAAQAAVVRNVPSLALYRNGVLAGLKVGQWPPAILQKWVRDLVKGEA